MMAHCCTLLLLPRLGLSRLGHVILWMATLMVALSCGDSAPSATSSSHLAVVGSDTHSMELSQAAPGVITIVFKILDHASDRSKRRMCGGTYIDDGVILTAKHCYAVDAGTSITYVSIFFGGESMDTDQMASFGFYASSRQQWTFVSHPHQDLGLMIFDVAELSYGRPDRAPLFEADHAHHGTLYQNVTFFGLGHSDLRTIKQYNRVFKAEQLYALSHNGELWPTMWHLVHSNLHWYDKGAYLVRALLSPAGEACRLPPSSDHGDGCKPSFNRQLRESYLLVGSTLSHLPELKAPKDVLFCRGDSGGGVRLADGSLVGIAVGYSVRINNYVGVKFGTYYHFDDELMSGRDCSSVMYTLDLQPYLPWIRQTIAAAGEVL